MLRLKPRNDVLAFTLAEGAAHVDIQNRQRKFAFTLAEVLITLGIIGVVAALTMPSLIQSSRKKEASSRLKKFYSVMSQAILFSELDNGPSADWVRNPMIKDEDGNSDNIANDTETMRFYKTYLEKYIKSVAVKEGYDVEAEDGTKSRYPVRVYFADGTAVGLNNGACLDMQFDVNGDRKPNIMGRDKFVFLLCPGYNTNNYFKSKKTFGVYGNAPTRESALAQCKTLAYSCSILLEYDGWEFKDDYPWRL